MRRELGTAVTLGLRGVGDVQTVAVVSPARVSYAAEIGRHVLECELTVMVPVRDCARAPMRGDRVTIAGVEYRVMAVTGHEYDPEWHLDVGRVRGGV